MNLWLSERSEFAKEQVVLNNQGMIWNVLKSLNLNPMDEDLFSTGNIGLLKAINTYEECMGYKFSSYAAICVRNEILMIFRRAKEVEVSFSLDDTIENGDLVFYSEVIPDKKDCFEDVLLECSLKDVFKCLTEKEREIISLIRSGKTQLQIGKLMGFSQPHIGRILKRACNKVKEELNA